MFVTKEKKDYIRKYFIKGNYSVNRLSLALGISKEIIRYLISQLQIISEQYPDKLDDYDFYLKKAVFKRESIWNQHLIDLLPTLVSNEPGSKIVGLELFRKYHAIYPNEYKAPTFCRYFRLWFKDNIKRLSEIKLKEKFTADELIMLRKWRRGNDRRLWQVSVLLMTVYTYHTITDLGERIECHRKTMSRWLETYKKEGLEGLSRPGTSRAISDEKRAAIAGKMDDLVHLVRQNPRTYGIDRASWTITDLAKAYANQSGKYIAQSTVSIYLKEKGIRFKRSREVIASTDKKFKEKYEYIQHVLSNLGAKEKFFSIDEYGPKSVRPKGGRILSEKGTIPVYQKVEKGKGWFICTCALELSTNQLTWFYSRHKDTKEMIRLIEVLVAQYKDQEKLFLSWDAASWHSSAQLTKYLKTINDEKYRLEKNVPEVLLAPLPSKTPTLNVIESVFSGLSKSVIHNSSYDSLEECTNAIDRYFNRRNQHYKENPQKAGKKIWGKEKVLPVFDKANITKTF